MAYTHTQPGRWHYVLFAFTLVTLGGAWLARSVPPIAVILLVAAAIDTTMPVCMFHRETV